MVTPQTESPEIAAELGVGSLWFKREDLHPLGSHKGRSIPVMIDMKIEEGATDFAISSSGNAALAAVRHIQYLNSEGNAFTLSILVGENINEENLKILRDEIKDSRIQIKTADRPLQALFNLIKGTKTASLRQSTDDDALVGYKSLAGEIASTPNLSAIFIGTSSGTAAQAIALELSQVNIVQTTSVSPIAEALGTETVTESPTNEDSLADAIVDKVAHRREVLTALLQKTGGAGWIATNEDIRAAQKLLAEKADIEATANGALGLAGLIHALKSGKKFPGAVVCIITGK